MIEDMWKQKKGKKVGLFHSCALRLVVLQKKMVVSSFGEEVMVGCLVDFL